MNTEPIEIKDDIQKLKDKKLRKLTDEILEVKRMDNARDSLEDIVYENALFLKSIKCDLIELRSDIFEIYKLLDKKNHKSVFGKLLS